VSGTKGVFQVRRTTGLLALWCIAILILMSVRPNFSNASKPQNGIPDPVLSLQMAHSITDVDAVLGDAPSADREVMRAKQYEDFGFIAGYLALYLMLAIMLAQTYPKKRWAAILAAIAGTAAAVFDVLENLAILRIVDAPLAQTSEYMIWKMHSLSEIKWYAGFVALLGVSLYFGYDRRKTAKIVYGINTLAAVLGMAALEFNESLLPAAAGLIGLGLIGGAIVLLIFR
jgi:hypothetical protein